MRSSLLLLLAIGLVLGQKAFHSRQIGTKGQVLSRLLGDYDAYTRPPVREHADHSSIVVIANLFINRVRWHDDRAEVDLYLRQQWEDARLAYEVDPREEIEYVSLPLNRKIWTPNTYFTTGNELTASENHKSFKIEPTGYVRASEGRTIDVPVSNGQSFPFLNRRSFTIRLSSYNYPLEDVVYLWANSPPFVNPVEVSNELLTGSITFEEASAGDCVGNYTVGMYSCVDVTVTFYGGALKAASAWFLPSTLLVFASWFHFWIAPSWSVPRSISAALPFFIFVVLFLFRTNFACSVTCWLIFCLIITFLSLLEYFITICCGVHRSLRYVTQGSTHPEEHPMGAAKETLEVAYDTKCASFRNSNGVDIISRVLFPIIFIVFLIIYLLVLV